MFIVTKHNKPKLRRSGILWTEHYISNMTCFKQSNISLLRSLDVLG
jgi:hypothetical protein